MSKGGVVLGNPSQESLLEDAIADGVKELFKNRLYLKRYPLKSFAHTMLRHETYPSKFCPCRFFA